MSQNAYYLDLEDPMSETEESGTKIHYICQTYIAKTTALVQQGPLKIDKQLQYSTPREAEERA